MPFSDAVTGRRLRLGLTLQQLATRSGVSAAMLSEVERGRKSPTLRVASQIAEGLGCPISALLDEEVAPRLTVRRRSERTAIIDKATGIERQSLSPSLLSHGMEAVWYVVPPGSASGTFRAQGAGVVGHLTVVKGSLECSAPSTRVRLGPGDSLDYPGDIRHAFRNPGRRPCEFILVQSTRSRAQGASD